jgi:hypothetical protein
MRRLRQLWSGASGEADGSMKTAIMFFAFLMFFGGFWLVASGNVAGAGVTYTAAVICLIFAFLSRFKRFKGLRIEAELWRPSEKRLLHSSTD